MHPGFDGQTLEHDVALLRFVGAPAAMPAIGPMSEAEDALKTGNQLEVVGLGRPTATRATASAFM